MKIPLSYTHSVEAICRSHSVGLRLFDPDAVITISETSIEGMFDLTFERVDHIFICPAGTTECKHDWIVCAIE